MIKFSFLKSLLDLPVADAEKAVFLAGHEFSSLPFGAARIALAVSNTVFLEHRDGIVTSAVVGDACELEDDAVTSK